MSAPDSTGRESLPAAGSERTPEERLEHLRFFTMEGETPLPKSLGDWMQEVERQISALRARMNRMPDENLDLRAALQDAREALREARDFVSDAMFALENGAKKSSRHSTAIDRLMKADDVLRGASGGEGS